jgi:hypothetical protein
MDNGATGGISTVNLSSIVDMGIINDIPRDRNLSNTVSGL